MRANRASDDDEDELKPAPQSAAGRSHWQIAAGSLVLLFIADQCVVLIHELAHGLTALALGGEFPFLHIAPGAGRAVAIFPYGDPAWKHPVMLLAGYSSHLLLSLLLLFVGPMSSVGGWRLFAWFTGAAAAIRALAGSGLATPWQAAGGEVGDALWMFGLPTLAVFLIKAVWLTAELVLAAVFLRRLFSATVDRCSAGGYWSRFRHAMLIWGVPWASLTAAYGYLSFPQTLSIGSAAAAFLVGLTLLLAMPLLYRGDASGSTSAVDGLRRAGAYSAVAAMIVVAYAAVFGFDRQNPRGLFLGKRPPEVTVAACNVRIRFDSGDKAHVTFLMRPFVSQHSFLWNRARPLELQQWGAYEAFFADNLPRLLRAKGFQITERLSLPDSEFYLDGGWSAGARVIESKVDLNFPASKDKPDDDRAVTINDFWKGQGIGYVDLVEVEVARGLVIEDVSMEPAEARQPEAVSATKIRWANRTYADAFQSSRLRIAGIR